MLYGGTLGRKKKKRKAPASEGGRYLRAAIIKTKEAEA